MVIFRRPLVAAGMALAGGIAAAHMTEDPVSGGIFAVSLAVGCGLLFYFDLRWQIFEILIGNGRDSGGQAPEGPGQDPRRLSPALGRKDVRRAGLILASLAVFGFFSGRAALAEVSAFDTVSGEDQVISGIVSSVVMKEEGKCQLVLRAQVPEDAGSGGISEKLSGAVSGMFPGGRRETLLVTVKDCDTDAVSLTGCWVRVTGTVSEPDGARIPGGFDYALYLRSRGILAVMRAESTGIREQGCPGGLHYFMNRLAVWKYDYEQQLTARMDDRSAGAFCGIMFGESGSMDEDLLESFRQNGIGHLLAASGLHVGFVYGLIRALMRRPRTIKGNIPVAAALLVYAALAGFSASVMRAVFMVFVHIVSQVDHRRYDFLSCIAFCFIVLLVYRPAYLFSSGFQLSFLAVATLSVVLKKAEHLSQVLFPDLSPKGSETDPDVSARSDLKTKTSLALKRRVVTDMTALAGIQAGMLPMSLTAFHYVSPAVILLNVPAIAIAGFIVPLGIIMIPFWALVHLGSVGVSLSGPLDALSLPASELTHILAMPASHILTLLSATTDMLVSALTAMSTLADDSPLSFRYLASPPMSVTLVYYFALFLLCSEAWLLIKKRSGSRIRTRRLLAALLIPAVIISTGIRLSTDWKYLLSDAVFVDVGQGDCIHLKGRGSFDMIIDSGGSEERDVGKETLIPYFLGNGIDDIDLAVITHLHTDHYGGLKTLTSGVKVKKLVLSAAYKSEAETVSEETGIPVGDMLFLKRGDSLTVGGIKLTVLSPEAESDEEYIRMLEADDENSFSLVLRAEYKGRSMIFTGDIGEDLERKLAAEIPKEYLDTDILKVAHHGSKTSSAQEFLDVATPEVSVIQVGAHNVYGHPTQEAMDRIASTGSEIYRTDRQGTVMLRLGKHIRCLTMQ